MTASASRILRFFEYKPLLDFVNKSLTRDTWQTSLQDLCARQLADAGFDPSNELGPLPMIDGSKASMHNAFKLQESMRMELASLAEPRGDESGPEREGDGSKRSMWRKAEVLPTGEMFFEDAGENLRFLAEKLAYEIKTQQLPPLGAEDSRRRKRVQLHLTLCNCGCGTFFLWEGNWNRKVRKFLGRNHRMRFHNSRNVEKKRDFARQQRAQGNTKYF